MSLKPRAGPLLAAGAIASLALIAVPADAAQINVSATIAAACSVVSDANLDFGTPSASLDTDATATLSITCSTPATVLVTLDGGLQPNSTTRRMKHTTLNEFLPYILYDGPAGGDPWLPGIAKAHPINGSPTPVAVGGRIIGAPLPPSGTYNDVVQITVQVQ